ncbi:NUDIX hydrolase [Vreelandella neptunia]|uniref:NUDIX hydrolase n=1 Tax=Vreelandella neptunia TaxID=115551 RepID=UPI003CCA5DF8
MKLISRSSVDFLIDHPGSVLALCMSQSGGQVLLVQVARAGQGAALEVPGGVIEHGESPEAACFREAREEAGFLVTHAEPLLTLTTSAGITNELVHIFHCKGNLVECGEYESRWLPLADARALIRSGRVVTSTTAAALLFLAGSA